MIRTMIGIAVAVTLVMASTAAAFAADRRPHIVIHRHHTHHHHYRHHHVYRYRPGIHMSYLHNYCQGPVPGTYTTCDGPVTALCRYSASAYLGQDRRRHPCN